MQEYCDKDNNVYRTIKFTIENFPEIEKEFGVELRHDPYAECPDTYQLHVGNEGESPYIVFYNWVHLGDFIIEKGNGIFDFSHETLFYREYRKKK